MTILPGEVYAKPGQPVDLSCHHQAHCPAFDADACQRLLPGEVRRRFPRFAGVCDACGQRVVLYASEAHYTAGDWGAMEEVPIPVSDQYDC